MKKLLCKIASKILKKYGIIEIDKETKIMIHNQIYVISRYSINKSWDGDSISFEGLDATQFLNKNIITFDK